MKVTMRHQAPTGEWMVSFSNIDFDDPRISQWVDIYNRNNTPWTIMEEM